MGKVKYVFPLLAIVLAITVHAFEKKTVGNANEPAWFAVDDITGDVIVPYEILEENACPEGDQYFCAALYNRDAGGNPVGELLDVHLKD